MVIPEHDFGMHDVISAIARLGILPTVVIDDAADAVPLGHALKAGGLPAAEVTFRTAAAPMALRAIAEDEEMLVGAGTVLTAQQLDGARDAGATFIVAPGFNPAVVERCRDLGLVVIPGVSTPTEIEMALNAGIDVVKFFPSEALGGVRMLRALSAPYTKVRFIPTGGVNSENVAGYLSLPCVLAVGGSWMVAPELVRAKRFDEVTRLTEHAMNIVRSVRS